MLYDLTSSFKFHLKGFQTFTSNRMHHKPIIDRLATHPCCVQSTLSKTDTFGTGTECPSERGVRLIESQVKGVKKGRDQL